MPEAAVQRSSGGGRANRSGGRSGWRARGTTDSTACSRAVAAAAVVVGGQGQLLDPVPPGPGRGRKTRKGGEISGWKAGSEIAAREQGGDWIATWEGREWDWPCGFASLFSCFNLATI